MAKVLVKATNRVQNVSGEALQQGLLDGSFALLPGQNIRVVTNPTPDDASTRPGVFSDYAQLGEALRSGRVRVASQQEVNRAEAENSPIQTALESAVPFGVGRAVSAAADALTEDPRLVNPIDAQRAGLEQARLRREVNPTAAAVGEVGGALATAFVPGAAANLAVRAGAATEGVLARAAASRATQLAAGTAVEGVGFSLLHSLDELALGDPELSAERVLADAGGAALLGGVLGGALGGGGALLRRLRSVRGGQRETAQLLARSMGETPKPLLVRGMDRLRRMVTRSRDADDVLRRMADDDALRLRVMGGKEVRDRVSRNLASHVDDSERLTRMVTEEATGELKASKVAQLVRRGNEDLVEDAARQTLARLESRIDEALALPAQHDAGIVQRLKSSLRRTAGRLDDARGDNSRMFRELDALKRDIGPEARFGRELGAVAPKVQRAAELADDAYHQLRSHLESTQLYGEAGNLQQQVNAAWTNYLGGSGTNVRGQFMRRMGMERGRPVYQTDPGKVSTYLNQMSRPGNDLRHLSLQQRLSAQEQLTRSLDEFYDLSPQAREAVSALKKNNTVLRQSVKEMEDTISAQNAFSEILRSERQTEVGSKLLRGSVASAIGGAVGGVPGSVAFGTLGVASTIARPATLMQRLHQVETVATKMNGRMLSGARNAVRGITKKLPKPPPGTLRRTGLLSAIASRDRNAMVKLSTQLSQLAVNPAQVQDAMVQETQGVPANVSGHMTLKTAALLAALTREAPVLGRHPSQLLGRSPVPPSDTELHHFAEFARGAVDPLSILESAAAGQVSPRAVKAVQELWPRLYEDMFDAVVDELGRLQEEGGTLPYRQRVALAMTFDLPTDPSLEPKAMALYQQNMAPQPQKQQSSPSASTTRVLSQPGLTTTERIVHRRAG